MHLQFVTTQLAFSMALEKGDAGLMGPLISVQQQQASYPSYNRDRYSGPLPHESSKTNSSTNGDGDSVLRPRTMKVTYR